jgi:hypothetical protein
MCPLYRHARAKLKLEIENHSTWNLDTILFGDENLALEKNQIIVQAVLTFIHESMRF